MPGRPLRIERSRIGALVCLALGLGVAAGLWALELRHAWAAMLVWVLACGWAWRGTWGLGRGGLELVEEGRGGWLCRLPDGGETALTGLRAHWVRPALVLAELETEAGTLALVVPADACSAGDHRRLRRLLLQGVQSSRVRGT